MLHLLASLRNDNGWRIPEFQDLSVHGRSRGRINTRRSSCDCDGKRPSAYTTPSTMRISTTTRTSPRPPLGPYPQPVLYPHIGIEPSIAKMRTIKRTSLIIGLPVPHELSTVTNQICKRSTDRSSIRRSFNSSLYGTSSVRSLFLGMRISIWQSITRPSCEEGLEPVSLGGVEWPSGWSQKDALADLRYSQGANCR